MKINGSLKFDASGLSQIENLRLEKLTATPAFTSADVGRLIYVTTTNVIWVGGSSSWIALAAGGNASTIASEVDAIEASLGGVVNSDGTFNALALSGNLSAATSVTNLFQKLQALLATNTAAIQTNTDSLALKAPINSPTFTGTVSGITPAMVGLGNVNNTSDATLIASAAFARAVRDAVAAMISSGSQNGITFTYDATAGTLSANVSGSGTTALSITGTPSSTGIIGTAYFFTPTTSGGNGTKVFSLATGTLPAGLAISSSTGAITGTPTTAGSSTNIAIRVTDSSGSATLTPFSITVSAATSTSTKPRYGVGAANAYTTPSTLFASMTEIPSSTNGSKVGGPFTVSPASGQYGWVAVLQSAGAGGVTFTDSLGSGGWSGAGLVGANNGASPSVSASSASFTDSSGTYLLFRQDYANSAFTGSIS